MGTREASATGTYSLRELCALGSFSRTTYYKLKRSGLTPAETRITSRIAFAKQTAQAWLASREQRNN